MWPGTPGSHCHHEVQVVERVAQFARRHPNITVALQPAVSDAHHLPMHPQPQFSSPAGSGITMLPSPSLVCINGFAVALTSVDVVKDLSAMEVAKQARPCTAARLLSVWSWVVCVWLVYAGSESTVAPHSVVEEHLAYAVLYGLE